MRKILFTSVTSLILFTTAPVWAECGDVNDEDGFNVADIVQAIDILFRGAPAPGTYLRLDVNNDGAINVADIVAMVDRLFKGGAALECPELFVYEFQVCSRVGGCTGPGQACGAGCLEGYSMAVYPEGAPSFVIPVEGQQNLVAELPSNVSVPVQSVDVQIGYYEADLGVLVRHLQLSVPLTSDNYQPTGGQTPQVLNVYDSVNKMYFFESVEPGQQPNWMPYSEQVNVVVYDEYDSDPLDDIGASTLFVDQASDILLEGAAPVFNMATFLTTGNLVAQDNPDIIVFTVMDEAYENLLCTGSFSPDNQVNSLFVTMPNDGSTECVVQ